jgi:hypothetical protein
MRRINGLELTTNQEEVLARAIGRELAALRLSRAACYKRRNNLGAHLDEEDIHELLALADMLGVRPEAVHEAA